MTMYRLLLSSTLAFGLIAIQSSALAATNIEGWGGTNASTKDSIANSRHNLSLSFGGIEIVAKTIMQGYMTNYGEVCVYCHTPHGAGTTEIAGAPLWNHTVTSETYELYKSPLASGSTPSQPGPNSITCLSCHDGTIAIDSIINMPGSNLYLATQETSQNNAFLNTFPTAQAGTYQHATMEGAGFGCQNCHTGGAITDAFPIMDLFAVGNATWSDGLVNDHPIGIPFPSGNPDFRVATGFTTQTIFFDRDSDSKQDAEDIRLYNSGGGYEVECATCHDPHGVMSESTGYFIPSFLRVENNGSALCLTCHIN